MDADILNPAEGSLALAVEELLWAEWFPHGRHFARRVKRVTDILLALVAIVLHAPILAVIAVAIFLDSPGPVIFRQRRLGQHGRPFMMFKFRSMVDGAEARLEEVLDLNEASGPVFKIREDPRVTRVGRLLRRLSLDEMPQFFNVLHGDMSLVGPRPPLPEEVARYTPRQRRRLAVRPGMTCIWQISGRSEVSFDEWVEMDLAYIENWSLLLDMQILLRTIPAVLSRRGAF